VYLLLFRFYGQAAIGSAINVRLIEFS